MAAIDKIYGTTAQWDELYAWLSAVSPRFIKWLYPRNGYNDNDRPISNFPHEADQFLIGHCPIAWVADAIRDQYGGKLP